MRDACFDLQLKIATQKKIGLVLVLSFMVGGSTKEFSLFFAMKILCGDMRGAKSESTEIYMVGRPSSVFINSLDITLISMENLKATHV